MLTKENILNTLKQVEDPELHQSIIDLNMVRNIQINGTQVSLDIILTIPGCPLKAKNPTGCGGGVKNARCLPCCH
ncbi:iron-sulfur cluster assembly protein [Lysinibacillus sp. MHQ-1]|nr:iron-sulfur cluster assembly protein [Lysinibacillus sp. MHQ-1]